MTCPPRTVQYQVRISSIRFVWNTTCASLVGGIVRLLPGVDRSGRDELASGRGEFLRPHHVPAAVLDLLELRHVVPVVVGAVEADLPSDCIDPVRLEPLRQRL